MRDSNPRGLAPNTLSKSAGACSGRISAVCGLARGFSLDAPERLRTWANETRTETRHPRDLRVLVGPRSYIRLVTLCRLAGASRCGRIYDANAIRASAGRRLRTPSARGSLSPARCAGSTSAVPTALVGPTSSNATTGRRCTSLDKQTRKADLALLFDSGAGVPPPEAMMSALTASGGRLCRLGRSAADLGGWLCLKAPLRRVRGLRLGIGDERPTTTLTDVLVIAVRWLLTNEGAPG